jgi:predicted HAD superfamily phosphohydrolase YqeG
MFVVDDLSDAVAIAADHGDLLILDIDNTLVTYGSSKDERGSAMAEAVETVAGWGLQRLAFITNGPGPLPSVHHESLVIDTVTAARKPYVRLPPLKRFRDELAGAAVYGDQPLTDGMLARNLGGIWIQPRHAHEPEEVEPWWPRVMRQAGRRAMDRHFELVAPPNTVSGSP